VEGSSKLVNEGSRRDLERAKDELETLRKLLADRDKQLLEEQRKAAAAAAEAEAAKKTAERVRVEVLTINEKGGKDGSGSPSAAKAAVAAALEEEEEEKKKKAKRASAANVGQGHGRRSGGGNRGLEGEDDGPGSLTQSGARDGLARSGDGERGGPSSSGDRSGKPGMVDKCVGGGPDADPEPLPRVRGRSVCAATAPELNRTGQVYLRSLRSDPNLGTGPGLSASMPSMPSTATTKALSSSVGFENRNSIEKRSAMVQRTHSGHGDVWPGAGKRDVELSTNFPGTSHGPGQSWRNAEPYLMQVWEHRSQGPKKSVHNDLMKLGALTPGPPQLNNH